MPEAKVGLPQLLKTLVKKNYLQASAMTYAMKTLQKKKLALSKIIWISNSLLIINKKVIFWKGTYILKGDKVLNHSFKKFLAVKMESNCKTYKSKGPMKNHSAIRTFQLSLLFLGKYQIYDCLNTGFEHKDSSYV